MRQGGNEKGTRKSGERPQRGRGAPKPEKLGARRPSQLRHSVLAHTVALSPRVIRGRAAAAGALQRASMRTATVRATQATARTVHPTAAPMAAKRPLTQCATR